MQWLISLPAHTTFAVLNRTNERLERGMASQSLTNAFAFTITGLTGRGGDPAASQGVMMMLHQLQGNHATNHARCAKREQGKAKRAKQ
jgi:hypothetical protein